MSAARLSSILPRGGLHGVSCDVSIAGGSLDLAVAKELADHRQAFAESESPGREGVTQVMCLFRS